MRIEKTKIFTGNLLYDLFTRREREITNLLVEGDTNEEISNKLFISTRTVEGHLNKMFKKLNARNRVDFAVKCTVIVCASKTSKKSSRHAS